jgi:hypothetical protein
MGNLLLLLTVFAVGFVLIGLSFLIGMVFGWFANEYFNPVSAHATGHPEMYDENGNYITEELIAVRFEEEDDEDDEED